jgi:hypothetical protein
VGALGAGALLLSALTGCSALLGSAAAVPSTSAAPPPSYKVTNLTVATPKPKTGAPALKTTGTAWPAILASLSGYGQWVLANPDPSKIADVAEPGCAMYDLLSQQTTALFEEKAYLKPSAPVFTQVVFPSPAPAGNEITLDVTATRAAEPVLSQSKAAPISTFQPLPATALQITLFQGSDKKWRFCTVDAWSDTGAADDPSVPLL